MMDAFVQYFIKNLYQKSLLKIRRFRRYSIGTTRIILVSVAGSFLLM